MLSFYIIIFVALLLAGRADGNSNGAPNVACGTMTPTSHNANGEQDAPCPFEVLPNKTQILSSETVSVRLSVKTNSTGTTYKGYQLMAFDSADNATAIGTWTIDSNVGKTMNCSFGVRTGVTHINNSTKTVVDAAWTPPQGYKGDLYFRASFVQVLEIFWVRVSAVVVKVL